MSTEKRIDLSYFDCAIRLMLKYHAGQKDKSGEPYIGHLLRVMSNSSLTNMNLKTVAVLHDILEDTNCTILVLGRLFPKFITEDIIKLTKIEGEPNIEYLVRVSKSETAIKVKLADINDNFGPERMSKLDKNTQQRLNTKYSFAVDFLTKIVIDKCKRLQKS